MALTRAEATELAVRRHLRVTGGDVFTLESLVVHKCPADIHSIRAHYRAICRTYGVLNTPPHNSAYDGHSLRI